MATPADTKTPGGEPSRAGAAAALRARGYRVTPQRIAIQETLVELGRHVSAEELLGAARRRNSGLSLPTVYAALDALEDAGLVRRIATGRGPALYDPEPADHHHLVCRHCGSVEDLEATVATSGALDAATGSGFHPEGAELVVHGLCERCG